MWVRRSDQVVGVAQVGVSVGPAGHRPAGQARAVALWRYSSPVLAWALLLRLVYLDYAEILSNIYASFGHTCRQDERMSPWARHVRYYSQIPLQGVWGCSEIIHKVAGETGQIGSA
ncbi:hypothetical protein GUJ93_ZPchr0009g1740 [Zizania palustris]|uniref:Uncharacterized protein n=1 Tax=Zizania palustris TaxID=103762 RepID=A0A8J5S6Z5_ZIZPA|nr:hypothetical protein GUJ93_ZPchr0009g1740 [Zizania palustris]